MEKNPAVAMAAEEVRNLITKNVLEVALKELEAERCAEAADAYEMDAIKKRIDVIIFTLAFLKSIQMTHEPEQEHQQRGVGTEGATLDL